MNNTTGVDTANLAAKSDLASLKAEIGKIDVGKLETVPADLSKLFKVVDSDAVKKTVYDKLVVHVNSIDTSRFISKTLYNTDKLGIEKEVGSTDKKITDISGLVKKMIITQKLLRSRKLEIEGTPSGIFVIKILRYDFRSVSPA